MMGGGPHSAFLPTLQRQFSLGLTLPLTFHSGSEPRLICSKKDSGKTPKRTSCLERVGDRKGGCRNGTGS